jgi:hypothetical protein
MFIDYELMTYLAIDTKEILSTRVFKCKQWEVKVQTFVDEGIYTK